MEMLNIDIKKLKDMENCEWNGKFRSPISVRIKNLSRNGIPFMERNEVVLDLVRVDARVSNFIPIGRTFGIRQCDSMRKYDGRNGEMYFLEGLYLDGKETPSYSLEFLEYIKGNELPRRLCLEIKNKDICILD